MAQSYQSHCSRPWLRCSVCCCWEWRPSKFSTANPLRTLSFQQNHSTQRSCDLTQTRIRTPHRASCFSPLASCMGARTGALLVAVIATAGHIATFKQVRSHVPAAYFCTHEFFDSCKYLVVKSWDCLCRLWSWPTQILQMRAVFQFQLQLWYLCSLSVCSFVLFACSSCLIIPDLVCEAIALFYSFYGAQEAQRVRPRFH